MASIADPLKYRGVFDYPNNQSKNLIDAGAPSTSTHVVHFMGWTGGGRRKLTFSGNLPTKSALEQKAAWMEEWLRKGQYAGRDEQQAEETSVGTQKRSKRRASAKRAA